MSVKKVQISSQNFELTDISSLPGYKKEIRPGGWIVLTDAHGKKTRLKAVIQADRISFHLNGKTYTGKLIESTFGQSSHEEESSLTAQFPGKVIKVLVKEGQKVAKGDSLLLMEAMKMEFNVESPVNGKVKKLLVAEGQQVLPGDQFIEMDNE